MLQYTPIISTNMHIKKSLRDTSANQNEYIRYKPTQGRQSQKFLHIWIAQVNCSEVLSLTHKFNNLVLQSTMHMIWQIATVKYGHLWWISATCVRSLRVHYFVWKWAIHIPKTHIHWQSGHHQFRLEYQH